MRFLLSSKRVILALTVMFALSFATVAYADGYSFPLSKGNKGADVYAVQSMLKRTGYYKGPITGFYGSLTAKSVAVFQKSNDLPETGNVDDETLEALLSVYAHAKIPNKPI